MTPSGSVIEIGSSVRAGHSSARQLADACLAAIEQSKGTLSAFLGVHHARGQSRAEAVDMACAAGDPPGPLTGVPVAVKDNICVTGAETTCGSKMLEGFKPLRNAHVVKRLEQAGAVVVGKTNLDEFGMGSTTENSAFGPTRNPWNLDHVPGGSSGGSAAAVAARLVPAALGSDTGGSVRLPAAHCGVVGLKPTYGLVSRSGLVAYGSSLDQVGTITTSAADCAALLGVIAGHDPQDATSVDRPVPDFSSMLEQPLAGRRIGLVGGLDRDGATACVQERVTEAVDAMRDAGAEVVSIDLPHLSYAVSCYYILATAEASSNLARYDGVQYGHRAEHQGTCGQVCSASRRRYLGDEVRLRIMLGTYALSSGYYHEFYAKARRVRTLVTRDFARAFESVDVIAMPVAPATAGRFDQQAFDALAMYLGDVYTVGANLAGLCAMSLPCGFDAGGLPVGLQLVGPSFGEPTLLSVAHQYQQITDHHLKTPPGFDSVPWAGA